MARCSVSSKSTCQWSKQAGNDIVSTTTTHVYFRVIGDDGNSFQNNNHDGTYMASVTQQRLPGNEVSTGYKAHNIGESYEVSDSFIYTNYGDYEAGYSITFGSGAGIGCEGKTFSEMFVVRNDETGCKLIEGQSADLAEIATQSPPIGEVTPDTETMLPVDTSQPIQNPSSDPNKNHICATSVYKAQETCSFAPTCNPDDCPCPAGLSCFPDIVCDVPRMVRQNYCAHIPQELTNDSCTSAPTCNHGEICPLGMSCFPNVLCSSKEQGGSEGEVSTSLEEPVPTMATSPVVPSSQTINLFNSPSKSPITTESPIIIQPASNSPDEIMGDTQTINSVMDDSPAQILNPTPVLASTPAPIQTEEPEKSPTPKPTINEALTWYPSRVPSSASQTVPTSSNASNSFSPTLISGEPPSSDIPLLPSEIGPQQVDLPDAISSAGTMYKNESLAIILILCLYVLHI